MKPIHDNRQSKVANLSDSVSLQSCQRRRENSGMQVYLQPEADWCCTGACVQSCYLTLLMRYTKLTTSVALSDLETLRPKRQP